MKKGVVSLLSAAVGAGVSAVSVGKIMGDKTTHWKKMSDKHLSLFLMMNQWVKVKQEGKSLVEYFEKNGYKNIAIYGMSYAGETLYDELKESDITVKYAIDQKADNIYADIDVLSMEDDLPEVDAIVVTAITFFDEIEKVLESKVNYSIISLEDVLYEV